MVEAPANDERLRAWRDALERLIDDMTRWAEARRWLVHRETKAVTERSTGLYEVPVLTIQTNQGRVRVEPGALDVMGAKGRVDVYAWPTLDEMLLVDFDQGWRVLDQNRVEIAPRLTEDVFVRITQTLAAAA